MASRIRASICIDRDNVGIIGSSATSRGMGRRPDGNWYASEQTTSTGEWPEKPSECIGPGCVFAATRGRANGAKDLGSFARLRLLQWAYPPPPQHAIRSTR